MYLTLAIVQHRCSQFTQLAIHAMAIKAWEESQVHQTIIRTSSDWFDVGTQRIQRASIIMMVDIVHAVNR